MANDAANAVVINNADGNNPRTIDNDTVDTGDIRGNAWRALRIWWRA